MLVHRLGSVDDEYRHKYNSGKHRLSVEQEYLLVGIQTIKEFSTALVARTEALALVKTPALSTRKMLDLVLDLELLSEEVMPVVDPEFFFLYNERYFRLRDLLTERTPTATGMVLRLKGPSGVIRAYKRKIKRLAEQHRLAIRSSRARNAKILSEGMLDRVRAELPAAPWTGDSEKAVAKKIGLKLDIVRECVRVLRIRNGTALGSSLPTTPIE